MSMDWFRWYHGTVSDPKFSAIARKTKQPKASVIAVWAAVLEYASQADDRGEERGTLYGLDVEIIAAGLDMDDEDTTAIISAMTTKGLIDETQVVAWNKRQVQRERDDDSKERVRKHRENKSGNAAVTPSNANPDPVTPSNATETPPEGEGEKEGDGDGAVGEASSPPAAARQVRSACPYAEIVALYHETLPELPQCRELTATRKKLLWRRWQSTPGLDLASWRRFFEYVRTCPFLMGQKGGTNGRPPFVADGRMRRWCAIMRDAGRCSPSASS